MNIRLFKKIRRKRSTNNTKQLRLQSLSYRMSFSYFFSYVTLSHELELLYEGRLHKADDGPDRH